MFKSRQFFSTSINLNALFFGAVGFDRKICVRIINGSDPDSIKSNLNGAGTLFSQKQTRIQEKNMKRSNSLWVQLWKWLFGFNESNGRTLISSDKIEADLVCVSAHWPLKRTVKRQDHLLNTDAEVFRLRHL